MPIYQISNLALHTDYVFPELREVRDAAQLRPVKLTAAKNLCTAVKQLNCYHTWQQFNAETWLNLYQQQQNFYVEYPEHCIFKLQGATSEISFQQLKAIEPELFQHLVLDQVIPLYLSLNYQLVLHASAVGTPELGASILVAQSGGGKSTIAAELSGYIPALADDFILCKFTPTPELIPTYPAFRFCEAKAPDNSWSLISESGKFRFALPETQFQNTGCKVRNIIFLRRTDELAAGKMQLMPYPTEQAIGALLQNIFVLETNSASKQASILEQVSWILETAKCYELSFSDLRGSGEKLFENLTSL